MIPETFPNLSPVVALVLFILSALCLVLSAVLRFLRTAPQKKYSVFIWDSTGEYYELKLYAGIAETVQEARTKIFERIQVESDCPDCRSAALAEAREIITKAPDMVFHVPVGIHYEHEG